jgi:hypothetical protein
MRTWLKERWLPFRTATAHTWLEHPLIDLAVAFVIVGGHLGLAQWRGSGFDFLGSMKFVDRMSLYTDLMTISGIFVGFSFTALAAYLALSGQNIERLREVAHGQVMKQWISSILGTSAVLLITFGSKIADRDGGAYLVHWIAWGGVVFLLLRSARLIYAFAKISGIATQKPFQRRASTRPIGVRKLG